YPYAGLVRDSAGNLYGTTSGGGVFGAGTVYKLKPNGDDYTILHALDPTNGDGGSPYAGLIQDSAGNLYGTSGGTVYKLEPSGTFTVLHLLDALAVAYPYAGLVRDSAGNLYGTTLYGGVFGYGTVYKLKPNGTFTVLHAFNAYDGASPYAGLVRDSAGNLYGTTSGGGAVGGGPAVGLRGIGTCTVLL